MVSAEDEGTLQQWVNYGDSPKMPCQGPVSTIQGRRNMKGEEEDCIGRIIVKEALCALLLVSTHYAHLTQSKVGSGVIKPYPYKPLTTFGVACFA